ncbi:MAG: hypothetical protein AABX25_02575, partial [Nanoarchaeota archaeon]
MGLAAAIDFSEFDVSATTGAITINDTGDAGNISIEGTILDINSLDFVAAGLLTTGAGSHLTFTPGTTGDLLFSTDADTVATFAGSAEGTANITLTLGDLTVTDGDFILSGGEIAATADDATGTNFSFTTGALTTGTGLAVASTSNAYSSGKIFNASLTQAAATETAVSGDIAAISFAPTYSTAIVTPSITGNVLDISRTSITNTLFASTLTISGALVSIADTSTATTGAITHTANVLFVDQNYATSSGAVISIENAGTGSGVLLVSSSTGDLITLQASGAGGVTTANGLVISQTGAGTITDAIDVSDEVITNAINVGDNTVLGLAAAIDFSEFDVSASTGSIAINDTGDAGNISIEGTILDINSLDFVAAG